MNALFFIPLPKAMKKREAKRYVALVKPRKRSKNTRSAKNRGVRKLTK